MSKLGAIKADVIGRRTTPGFCGSCHADLEAGDRDLRLDGVALCEHCHGGDLRRGRWDFSARDVSRTPRWLADGCRRAPHTGRRA